MNAGSPAGSPEQEAARLRALLAQERADFAGELEAGAAELARQDERLAGQRRQIEQLRRKARKLERESERRRLRIRELEEDLAFYSGSRPLRLAAGLVRRVRRRTGGP